MSTSGRSWTRWNADECASDPRFAHRLSVAAPRETRLSVWRRLTSVPVLLLAGVVGWAAFALQVSSVGLLLFVWACVAATAWLVRSVRRGHAQAEGRDGPRDAASAGPDGAIL